MRAAPRLISRGIWELEPPWTEEWDLGDSSDLQDRLAPSLQLRVTGPGAAAAASTRPHPVLLFFNGFLVRSTADQCAASDVPAQMNPSWVPAPVPTPGAVLLCAAGCQ